MNRYNLESISEKLIDNITDLLDHFGIEYQDFGNRIMFKCPIHGGDSDTNSSIMKRGIGNWRCFSEQCHENFGSSNGAGIIHFIQAMLQQHEDEKTTFYQAIVWAAKFVGEEVTDEALESADESKTEFIQLCKYINRKRENYTPVFTPRNIVRTFLKIPAEYYIKRGYSEGVLDKFDVGYCFNTGKSFFDRIITPFYDDRGEYMIGCSGRSKYERCTTCNLYHDVSLRCPMTKEEKLKTVKWKHSSNFQAGSYLYNYWNARSHIMRDHTVIIVEGPGDVWRLEEAGIHVGVAILGAALSSDQKLILEESGAINLIIATDSDDTGKKAAKSITESCRNLFNIKSIEIPEEWGIKDPGGLSIDQVKQLFIPILERI
jgi:DNA primase